MKARRMLNRSTYNVFVSGLVFMVTLTRLKNGYCGNSRYEAVITQIRESSYLISAVYRFDGHYFNEENEAHWIANYHYEKEIAQ